MSENERRTGERLDAVILVQLDDEGRYGVSRDASERGVLIATREQLRVGDRIDVVIHAKGQLLQRKARIVRLEKAPPSEEWPFRAALELDEALPKEVLEEGTRAAATFLRSTSASERPKTS